MYTSVAYLGEMNEDIVSDKVPLLVTAVGFYRVLTLPEMTTARPFGRGDYQLLYVASGRAHFTFDGHESTLGAGEAVLYHPREGQLYRYCAAEKPEVYWVHFTGNAAEPLLLKYGFQSGENVFFADGGADVRTLFDKMIAELRLRREGYEHLLSLLLEEVLLTLRRAREEGRHTLRAVQDELSRAVQYFGENYNRPISVERYADGCHMSVSGFIRHFARFTGQTPMQYILSLRLMTAKNLLEHTDGSISQIAAAVGYENALYFSRLFSKHTGLSPRAYRESVCKRTDGWDAPGEQAIFHRDGDASALPLSFESFSRIQGGNSRIRVYGEREDFFVKHTVSLFASGVRTEWVELCDKGEGKHPTAVDAVLPLPDGRYEALDTQSASRLVLFAKEGKARLRLRLPSAWRKICISRKEEA